MNPGCECRPALFVQRGLVLTSLAILATSANAAVASQPPQPDFGPNVMIVGPDQDAAGVQAFV